MKTKTILDNCPPQLRIILISIFMLFAPNLKAQEGYFEQGYGTTVDEEGYDVQVTPSYQVFMAGYTLKGSGNKDVYLVYTDSIGDTLWTKSIGGLSNDIGRAVWQKDASSWFVAGYTNSKGAGGYDAYFIKIESNGNAAFDVATGTSDDDYAFDVAQCSDGNFILVGYSNIGGTNKDILVIKADSTNGNVLWTKHFGGSGNQEGRAVITKTDGHIAITGTDYSGSLPQAFLLELDSTGTQIAYQTLNQSFSSYANSFAMDRDGGYWLAGYTANGAVTNALIAHINAAGAYVSHTAFGGTGNEEFNSITRVGNVLFMAGSTSSYGEGGTDLYFVVADSVGNQLFDEYAGGTGTDYANGMFHRNGLIYLTGYNNSFGVAESGNLYGIRVNAYELANVIQSIYDATLLIPIEHDCSMPRVLYVENMFGNTLNGNYKICTWCGNGDYSIAESEILDSSIYKGLIGNPNREQRLLDFCLLHGFNQIYFYNSAHLFWNTWRQLNSNYTVTLSGGGSKNLVLYLQEKMHAFLTKAYKNYYIDYAGLVGASFVDSVNDYNIYFNTQQYNLFANTFNYYNYSFAGKLKQVVLEHEFWKIDPEDPNKPTGPPPHTAYYADRYQKHKDYLQRMLTLFRNDNNIRHIDDYIAQTYNTDETNHTSRDSIELLRTGELEMIKDSVYNRKYITRFFLTYGLNSRWPFVEGENHCGDTNTNFVIWGRQTPYIPWHRDDYSYRTMMFGHRPNNKTTEVYPIFYGTAGCLDDRLTRNYPINDDNHLGFWLGVVDPNNTSEQRTLARAEELFISTFSQNTSYYHADRGPNLKINGFTYFDYELLEVVNELNIAKSFTNNFSDNHPSARIVQNDTFSNNSCWYNIPLNAQGQFGEVNQGKVALKDKVKPLAELSISPNPATNTIDYIITANDKSTKVLYCTIAVYDALGKLCIYKEKETLKGVINTSSLPKGIYFVKCISFADLQVFESTKTIVINK